MNFSIETIEEADTAIATEAGLVAEFECDIADGVMAAISDQDLDIAEEVMAEEIEFECSAAWAKHYEQSGTTGYFDLDLSLVAHSAP